MLSKYCYRIFVSEYKIKHKEDNYRTEYQRKEGQKEKLNKTIQCCSRES